MKKKVLLLAIIVAAIFSFLWLDAGQWLSFQSLKNSIDELRTHYDRQPQLMSLFFFAFYVLVTALSLPGAAVMTLAGGAIFGLFWGTILVSFASSVGALLSFLGARYLFRETLEKRFAAKLTSINEGINKEGALFLFSARLVPALPFFLINLLSGLTRMPAATFYGVSQLGMLLGTIVYVNAGTQLANLQSVSDILSLPILLSFSLLGIAPWLGLKARNLVASRKLYSNFKRPKTFDKNLIVIGAGAAGLVTSYIAAAVRAKVTLIEGHKMGGDCLNFGCVPSKALIRSAKAAYQLRQSAQYGIENTDGRVSFKDVMARVIKVISEIEPHDSVERYTKLGVEVRQGQARIVDPWTVEVTDSNGRQERLTACSLVIATGARPAIPEIPGLNEVPYVTSDTLWKTFSQRSSAPQRLAVLGGGPIGCELAQAFARLGSSVTLIESSDSILNREDPEVSTYAQKTLESEGIEVRIGSQLFRAERLGDVNILHLRTPAGESKVECDELLIAVGRQPRLEGFGLEELKIRNARKLPTNEYLETLFPNIFAAGDVIGPYQLTHVAAHQAWYASVNALFGRFKKFKVDYSVIPAVTFLDPEIARVGLNEKEAIAKNISYETVKYDISDLDRAIADGNARGWIKVLTHPGTDKILGATIVSSNAGEMLSEFTLAMRHKLGLQKILSTVHPYPTWTEANKFAAGEWKRVHAPEGLLKLVERFHQWSRG